MTRPEQTEPEHSLEPVPGTAPRVDPNDPKQGVVEHEQDEVTSAERAANEHDQDEENVRPLDDDPREPREPPQPFSGPSR